MIGQLPMVFAHHGGIVEIAMFVLPAVAVIVFLRRAERRARNEDNRREPR